MAKEAVGDETDTATGSDGSMVRGWLTFRGGLGLRYVANLHRPMRLVIRKNIFNSETYLEAGFLV